MSLWIVVGNRHPTIKAGAYVRLYTDHYRLQRVIPTPENHFKTEDASKIEYTLAELEKCVFPVAQKQNKGLFAWENGQAIFRNKKKAVAPSPLILPGDEGFSL